MNKIAIYTITSALHDKDAIDKASKEFLDSLNIAYTLHGDDFTTYGQSPLNLIYVRSLRGRAIRWRLPSKFSHIWSRMGCEARFCMANPPILPSA